MTLPKLKQEARTVTLQIWTELRYGTNTSSIRLAKLSDPELLSVFRKRALERARIDAQESAGVDPVIHMEDKLEFTRLKKLFDLIVPAVEIQNGL
jgi:hypothetical protein